MVGGERIFGKTQYKLHCGSCVLIQICTSICSSELLEQLKTIYTDIKLPLTFKAHLPCQCYLLQISNVFKHLENHVYNFQVFSLSLSVIETQRFGCNNKFEDVMLLWMQSKNKVLMYNPGLSCGSFLFYIEYLLIETKHLLTPLNTR